MKPGKQLSGLFRVIVNRRLGASILTSRVALFLLCSLGVLPLSLSGETPSKSLAPEIYDQAVQLRTILEGKPKRLRTSNDYLNVINKYRSVYHQFPSSSRADDALLAVAELYQLMGSDLKNPRHFQQAIQAYVFLEREYPASPYGAEGLFTAAEIYLNDLGDPASAEDVFKELLRRYPHAKKARNARARLDDLRTQLRQGKKSLARGSVGPNHAERSEPSNPRLIDNPSKAAQSAQYAGTPEPAKNSGKPSVVEEGTRKPSVIEVIRYWNTEEYTRLVINTGREVKFIEGRLDSPVRVFLDIENVRLSTALVGRTFVLNDGYVNKIRFGQSKDTVARVVLDMGSFKHYQVLRLSDPPRLVVNVQGGARREEPQGPLAANSQWKARYGEPLADELDLRLVPKKSGVARAAVEHEVASQRGEPDTSKPPTQTNQERTTKPASEALASKTAETGTASVAVAPREQESKSIARSSAPKSDGTRSLIRTLGLKVGRIVIDPGHGGHDTGTVGPSGLQEKDLVLDIALKLKTLVEEKLGSEVLLTRADDTFVPLEERTAMANQSQADLFLSIHANSSRNRRVSGVETFFLDFASSSDAEEIAARENSSAQKTIFELQDLVQKIALKEKIEESRELAQIVQKSVTTQLQKAHRQTRDRGVKQAPFIVLIGANMPSILSEVSFVSNPSDEKLLKSSSYRQKLAEALCRGIEAYAEALGGIKTARNLP